jgi:multidrug resistance efflux pump
MNNIAQPEVFESPNQPKAIEPPKPPEVIGKPNQAKVIEKPKAPDVPEVVVAQVQQQDFTGEVEGTGTVNVDVLATIGAKIPGRIERVLVNEGDFVHAGQVVATLEDTDIRQVLQRSEDRVETARMAEQAAIATEQAARATERSTRAMEQSRRASEFQAGRAWEREKHLVATGAVSQEEADQYQERERTAESAVGAAEADIGAAHAAHSEIAATEAEVRLQQFNLSQTKIFTYVHGIVTDRPKRSGDAIVSGETVLTVADPKVTLVEAYLDQRLAGQITAGQTATVIVRGRTKTQIPGRVYRIRPQADPAAEEMTVEIFFPLPPAELQIGRWADIYVRVSQTKNALVVPKSAVMTMGDGRYVLVANIRRRETTRGNCTSVGEQPGYDPCGRTNRISRHRPRSQRDAPLAQGEHGKRYGDLGRYS